MKLKATPMMSRPVITSLRLNLRRPFSIRLK